MKLEQNLLRALALMQHQGEDFFIIEDKAFKGTEEEAREQFYDDIEGTEEADIDANFLIFCENNLEEIEELDPDDYNNDYMVLTDEEADEKWEESLDSYIEECITPEIDKLSEGAGNLSYYITFDEEQWKRDARMDGRGHSLSTYDGNEDEETIEGEIFYIYRIN
jgi:hypothetical protein